MNAATLHSTTVIQTLCAPILLVVLHVPVMMDILEMGLLAQVTILADMTIHDSTEVAQTC